MSTLVESQVTKKYLLGQVPEDVDKENDSQLIGSSAARMSLYAEFSTFIP